MRTSFWRYGAYIYYSLIFVCSGHICTYLGSFRREVLNVWIKLSSCICCINIGANMMSGVLVSTYTCESAVRIWRSLTLLLIYAVGCRVRYPWVLLEYPFSHPISSSPFLELSIRDPNFYTGARTGTSVSQVVDRAELLDRPLLTLEPR